MARQICQSCGMPIGKDERKGTRKDGSLSTTFCKFCYKNGEYTWQGATAEQMQIYCTGILMKRHWPGFAAKLATHNIPKLARWREQKQPA